VFGRIKTPGTQKPALGGGWWFGVCGLFAFGVYGLWFMVCCW